MIIYSFMFATGFGITGKYSEKGAVGYGRKYAEKRTDEKERKGEK